MYKKLTWCLRKVVAQRFEVDYPHEEWDAFFFTMGFFTWESVFGYFFMIAWVPQWKVGLNTGVRSCQSETHGAHRIKTDYFIESAPYGLLFTSRKTLETNEWASKVLQRLNQIHTKHFLWCNLFVIYVRPISCNKPSKYNSVFLKFHTVKYRIIFHRFIAWKWPYIYIYIYIYNSIIPSIIELNKTIIWIIKIG